METKDALGRPIYRYHPETRTKRIDHHGTKYFITSNSQSPCMSTWKTSLSIDELVIVCADTPVADLMFLAFIPDIAVDISKDGSLGITPEVIHYLAAGGLYRTFIPTDNPRR